MGRRPSLSEPFRCRGVRVSAVAHAFESPRQLERKEPNADRCAQTRAGPLKPNAHLFSSSNLGGCFAGHCTGAPTRSRRVPGNVPPAPAGSAPPPVRRGAGEAPARPQRGQHQPLDAPRVVAGVPQPVPHDVLRPGRGQRPSPLQGLAPPLPVPWMAVGGGIPPSPGTPPPPFRCTGCTYYWTGALDPQGCPDGGVTLTWARPESG